eukprot:CAMPEP_0185622150 /NCGR_PEP_ID=MMETSP0436-20130131/59051_1 /TAXON_ID=626734 ORGANISM="Favella taraikaensis, Strain Fe Narragansett Bay" /NCGR_SAMPLE_ID=MMETSP0436 /ASSEMBLY_ACC=CAM_ASM_000390 /LENGTH=92 /DNA_ID=CAMNT_0028263823 /DNA_START=117 /DNA_END=395 /DNA_ORIENTATION=+
MSLDLVALFDDRTFAFLGDGDGELGWLRFRLELRLLNFDDLDAEEEHGAGGNLGPSSTAVSIVGRADQFRLASFLQTDEALIPAFDDLAMPH